MMVDMIATGKNLKRFREALGLTQADLAVRICVTIQTISKWENGKVLPTIDNLVILAAFHGVRLDDIIVTTI